MSSYLTLSIKHVDWSGIRDLPRQYRQIVKQAMLDTAEFWHARIFPRHFEAGAAEEYGYAPRTKGYLARKARAAASVRDLVLSGQSRRWMLTLYKVSGTSRSFRVRMSCPTYFTSPFTGQIVRSDGSSRSVRRQPDKPNEATRISLADETRMRDFCAGRVRDLVLARVTSPRVIELRGKAA